MTSKPSKNKEDFLASIENLYNSDCDVSRLLTGSIGMVAESGELIEIVKKQLFQGKPYSEENIIHMQKELGDIIFYWMNACIALNINPSEVINMNIEKLQARYPGGHFEIVKSEIRKVGDI